MVSRKAILRFVPVALGLALLASPVLAEDVAKKWRVSLGVGGYNANDEIESAAANQLLVINPCLRTNTCDLGDDLVSALYRDPRDDSSVFGNLDIQAANIGTIAVQYGVHTSGTTTFVIEGSVGYQKGDVGDVEVGVQFVGDGSELDEIPFNFRSYRVPAGELERVPIQLSALARFRPRATFNPYFGLGVGYSIIGFETDPELDQLSLNMDASRGVQMRLTNALFGGGSTTTDGFPQVDLEGAAVDAGDTFEWHLVGGAELTIKRRWALFLDVRWIDAARKMSISFNGSDELGKSVPNFIDFGDTELAQDRYGPSLVGGCPVTEDGLQCTGGGLLDVGSVVLIPGPDAAPGLDCDIDPLNNGCVVDFLFEPDGELDPGQYYVQGGTIDYDGFTLQLGFRYTF